VPVIKIAAVDSTGRVVASPEGHFRVGEDIGQIAGHVAAGGWEWPSEGSQAKVRLLWLANQDCWLVLIYPGDSGRLQGFPAASGEGAWMSLALEASCDEMWVANAEGRILFVNPVCQDHYGVPPEELIGRGLQEVIDQGLAYPPILPVVLREKRRVTIEQDTVTGCRLTVTATPVFNEQGQLSLIVGNVRDITALEDMKRNYEKTKALVERYRQEVTELRRKETEFGPVVAQNPSTRALLDTARRVAGVDSSVLILGESGTGKDVLARYIHHHSRRNDGPFMKINCAAIPGELLESELFGYSPGAFTGATRKGKAGLIALADKGTLFLDEIADMSMNLQAKMLQVIEEQKFTPLGDTRAVAVDIRVIAATNRKISVLINEGLFREDLFYRLNVIQLLLLPLRERQEDILPLMDTFLRQINKRYDKEVRLSRPVKAALQAYGWPGNVRELKHLLESLVVTATEPLIGVEHLPEYVSKTRGTGYHVEFHQIVPLYAAIEGVERSLITKAFRELGSSYKVAEALGVSQATASRKIRKYLSGS
jgi:PAS domain S-box-containing protein